MNKTYLDAPFTINATTDAIPSYNAFTYSVPTNNGVATVNGNVITIIGAGTVTVTATQAANVNYNTASKTATLTVAKANQTLTTEPIIKFPGDEDFDPLDEEYFSTSAVPSYFSLTYSVPDGNEVASVVNNKIRVLNLGQVDISVTQASNTNYNSTTATIQLNVVPFNPRRRTRVNLYNSLYSKRMTIEQFRKRVVLTSPNVPIHITDGNRTATDIIDILLQQRDSDFVLNYALNQQGFNETNYIEAKLLLLEQHMASTLSYLEGMESGVYSLSDRLETEEKHIDSLVTRLQKTHTDIQELDQTITLESAIESLNTRVEENELKTEDASDYADRIDLNIVSTITRVDNTESQFESLNVQYSTIADHLGSVTNQVQDIETELEQLDQTTLELEAEELFLVTRLTEIESHLVAIDAQHSIMDMSITQALETQQNNEMNQDTIDQDTTHLEQYIESTTIRVSNIESTLDKLNIDCVALESTVLQITEEHVEVTESNIGSIDQSMSIVDSTIYTTTNALVQVEDDINSLNQDNLEVETTITSTINIVSEIESDIYSLINRLNVLNPDIAYIMNTVDSDESGVIHLDDQIDLLNTRHFSLIQQVDTVETDISEIKQTLIHMVGSEQSTLQLVINEILSDPEQYAIEALESRINYLENIIRYYTQTQ
jgi:chromosome segregation ATPase